MTKRPEFLTIASAALISGRSYRAVRKLIDQGLILTVLWIGVLGWLAVRLLIWLLS